MTDDEALNAFWDRIESSYGGWISPAYHIPDEQVRQRVLTTFRERTGREEFGDAYLRRDNIAEIEEELADALVYLHLETRRDEAEGIDPEWDVVLQIVDHILAAQLLLPTLARKHQGAPA